ncbi:hypothetical protein pb186bvf_004003 [Paramecium bursaria]
MQIKNSIIYSCIKQKQYLSLYILIMYQESQLEAQQADLRERMMREFLLTEVYVCPMQKNHRLQSADKLKNHIHTCRDLKFCDQIRTLYICQFWFSHMFLDKDDRDNHEKECRFGQLPGNIYNPQAQKSFHLQPDPKAPKATDERRQMGHYDYALKKGLIKQKQQEEDIPENSFEFNKNYNSVYTALQQQLYKEFLDQSVIKSRLIIPEYDFTALPLNQYYQQFLKNRQPYNEHFKRPRFYSEEAKNKILQTFEKKSQDRLNFQLTQACSFDRIDKYINFHTYDEFLRVQYDEYMIQQKVSEGVNTKQCYFSLYDDGFVYVLLFSDILNSNYNLQKFKEYISQYTALIILKIPYQEEMNEFINDDQPLQDVIQELQQFDMNSEAAAFESYLKTQNQLQQQKLRDLNAKLDQLKKFYKDQDKQIKVLKFEYGDYEIKLSESKKLFEDLKQRPQKAQMTMQRNAKINITEYSNQLHKDLILYEQEQNSVDQGRVYQLDKLKYDSQNQNENLIKLKQEIERKDRERQLALRQLQKHQEQVKQLQNETTPNSTYYPAYQLSFIENESILCKLCKTHKINVMFEPCMHAIICQHCYDNLEPILAYCYSQGDSFEMGGRIQILISIKKNIQQSIINSVYFVIKLSQKNLGKKN